MAYLIGAVLAVALGVMASLVGLDRERSFYPTVLMVIALLYALFTAIGGDGRVLAYEALPIAGFMTVAAVGFKRSLWLVVAGLAAHGVFDAFHGQVIANPGVPAWWPPFCLAYDVVAAAYLAVLLVRRAVPARAA